MQTEEEEQYLDKQLEVLAVFLLGNVWTLVVVSLLQVAFPKW